MECEITKEEINSYVVYNQNIGQLMPQVYETGI